MSFELYVPKCAGKIRVKPGRWRLDRSGQVTLAAEDLRRAGIQFRAACLACKTTRRIAVRTPRDGEPSLSVGRGTGSNEVRLARNGTIGLRSVWSMLGVDFTRDNGEYVLAEKDGLLILEFTTPNVVERVESNGGKIGPKAGSKSKSA